ncbi:hypothetical protein M2092_002376 [Fusobacterium sp. PH5-44]
MKKMANPFANPNGSMDIGYTKVKTGEMLST